MARATKSGRHQLNLYDELKDILNEYSQELFDAKERGLDKAADYLLTQFEQNSPQRTGTLKNSWLRTYKYKNIRYIGNSALAGKNEYKYNIPLLNIIEFSKNGKPFVRATFERNKEQVINIIKGEIENGNSK